MAKTTLGKNRANNLLQDIKERDDLKLDKVVVTTKEKMVTLNSEKRSSRVQSMLKPSEREKFQSSIMRLSESDAIRELILIALGEPTDNPAHRKHIESLLKS